MTSSVDVAHEPVVRSMSEYFLSPSGEVRTAKFSESDIQDITQLLSHSTSKWKDSWSLTPRVYCALRLIDLESKMDNFGITSDIGLPFDKRRLPSCLSPSEKQRFLSVQPMVLTDSIYLEKVGGECRHVHFRNDDELPLIKQRRLGRGAFGVVHMVQSKVTHKVYARKETPRASIFLKSDKEIAAFKKERDAMMKLSHRHCIKFMGSYTTPNYLSLLVSPVAEMNLEEFLSERQTPCPRKNSLLREFFGCLSRAFRYIHEETNIRHRDVKPANILIHDEIVKISDFGLSLDWTGGHTTTTAGTCPGWSPRYCAPEVAQLQLRNSSSDIWSLGCVFLEMVTVLKGETVDGLLEFIRAYNTEGSNDRNAIYHSKPKAITAWTEKLKALSREDDEPIRWVIKMLDHEKEKRPHAAELVDNTCSGVDTRWLYYGNCCANSTPDGTDNEQVTDDSMANIPLGDPSHEILVAASTPTVSKSDEKINEVVLEAKLRLESQNGNEEEVQLLLEHGINFNAMNENGQTALHLAAEKGHQAVAALLLKNGADVHATDHIGGTPLLRATQGHYVASARLLLDSGADINVYDSNHWTPMHAVIQYGREDMVKTLLRYQPDLSIKDFWGNNPFHLVINNSSLEVMNLVLKNNPDIEARTSEGKTPLHLAAETANVAKAKLLLEHGADVNSCTLKDGSTAMHEAAKSGNQELAKLLREFGADVSPLDKQGYTPVDLARSQGRTAMVELIDRWRESS